MHSNWKIWDLLKSRPQIIDAESANVIAIQSFDPFAFKFIRKKIPNSLFLEEKLLVKSGKDVTTDWLEENFLSLGLFGNSESFLILNAENLSKPCKELLLDIDKLILDDRFLLLDYSKEDDLLKKIKTHERVECLKIQAPGFWEHDKLLDFLCDQLGVYLTIDAKDLILQRITADMTNLHNILSQINLNYPGKVNVSAQEVAELIQTEKVDQFELASDFGSKKLKKFYSKLARINDFDDLRQIFMFMQSHLLKIYDPSYAQAKPRLTKYDKEIIAQSKIWKHDQLDNALIYFSNLEIQAKSRNPLLSHTLRKDQTRFL